MPLDVLQDLPGGQLAGRFAIDVAGLMLPPRGGAGSQVRLLPHATLARVLDLPLAFDEAAEATITRRALREQVLVFRPAGTFFSTDELGVSRLRMEGGEVAIDVMVTHVESQDGEEAPRDLYLLVAANLGSAAIRTLKVAFAGRRRDFKGRVTPIEEPVAATQIVSVAD